MLKRVAGSEAEAVEAPRLHLTLANSLSSLLLSQLRRAAPASLVFLHYQMHISALAQELRSVSTSNASYTLAGGVRGRGRDRGQRSAEPPSAAAAGGMGRGRSAADPREVVSGKLGATTAGTGAVGSGGAGGKAAAGSMSVGQMGGGGRGKGAAVSLSNGADALASASGQKQQQKAKASARPPRRWWWM